MDVQPFDWARIAFGEEPPWFLAEILFRTGVIYIYTLVLLRWIGGRSIAQLSVVEFLLVIALGSAVGDAMFYADVPLLHAMLVITLVVFIDKAIDMAIRRWGPVKNFVDGKPTEMVRDGRMSMHGLSARGMGAYEVMEMLRRQGVRNLGEVSHAYLEATGGLSVFRDGPGIGLPLVPPPELGPPPPAAGEQACCINCGLLDPPAPCPECGEDRQTGAKTC
ncbi:DUF421 domain-containing protein [Falsirhodobacter xinxiangensis]|uniref:DUF421 domain-containing protein n=1 Tax=Falsirhodobacter xinxiangensis TaxID=2530049 RepID=UPI0010A9D5E5|nr:YetF domain-containing protein [Rhodobacter xinxiangensis]